MPEKRHSSKRSRAEIANSAAMGATRRHGPTPMVRGRVIKKDSPDVVRRNNKILGVAVAGTAVLSLFAWANNNRQEAEARINGLPKVAVTVEPGDTIEGLMKSEVSRSLADPKRLGEISITPFIDKAVEWNGGSSMIRPDQVIFLPDFPNEPDSVAYKEQHPEN